MTTDIQLGTLESRGLITEAARLPELEYLFRHALVQDAAYGSLLKQERRELHGRVGEALETLYPDRRAELAPVLAMHFEQAGETAKAIDYYAEAGRHAIERNAIQESFAAYDRGAALINQGGAESPATGRQRVLIELGRAQSGYSFRSPEESFEALEHVVGPAEELGDLELIGRVHMLIALGRLQNGQPADSPPVKRSLDRIAEVAKALDDPSMEATPLALVGLSQVFAGPVKEGVAKLEQALPRMEAGKDSIGAAFARGALAIGYSNLGEFDKAEAAAKEARELADARGDLIAQLDAQIAESWMRSMRGQLDRAVPLALDCVERSEETGATACMVASSWILGDAFHRQGQFDKARDVLKRGSDVSLVTDRRVWRPTLVAWLGTSTAALGEAGDTDYDEALATAREIHNINGEAGILLKRAEARAASGDLDGAQSDFAESARFMEEQGQRPWLARVLRSWADALRDANRADEAAPIYRRALALFEELGLDTDAAAVRTALSLGDTKLAF